MDGGGNSSGDLRDETKFTRRFDAVWASRVQEAMKKGAGYNL